MVRFLQRHIRFATEDDQAVVNAVLPFQAAHNLVFSAVMLLQARTDTPSRSIAAASQPTVPQTLEELINTTISLSFDQKSLELAIHDLAAEVQEKYPTLPFAFDIHIAGGDLQLSGITRNQQISNFRAAGKTLGEVLTALVLRANPVTSVTRASDPEQKLVWVIGPDPSTPDRQILLITTRDAAARHGYQLPRSFLTE